VPFRDQSTRLLDAAYNLDKKSASHVKFTQRKYQQKISARYAASLPARLFIVYKGSHPSSRDFSLPNTHAPVLKGSYYQELPRTCQIPKTLKKI
jgi:hypothetical protein